MNLTSSTARIQLTAYLLLAIVARSLVAPGWMLQTSDGGTFAGFDLVICPKQSPELHKKLSDQNLRHEHEHRSSSEPTLSVVDPGCSLWSGSDTEFTFVIPVEEIEQGLATSPFERVLNAQKHPIDLAHPARAPPLLILS